MRREDFVSSQYGVKYGKELLNFLKDALHYIRTYNNFVLSYESIYFENERFIIFGHKSIIIELVNANRKNAKATHHVYIEINPNAKTFLEVRTYVIL